MRAEETGAAGDENSLAAIGQTHVFPFSHPRDRPQRAPWPVIRISTVATISTSSQRRKIFYRRNHNAALGRSPAPAGRRTARDGKAGCKLKDITFFRYGRGFVTTNRSASGRTYPGTGVVL